MYYVYVLWSESLQKRYVGSASDVADRIKQHNSGSNRFTRGGTPWILIHQEEYPTRTEALKREKFLKRGVGRAWLEKQFPQYTRKKL